MKIRNFIELLKDNEELQIVESSVDWKYEIGSLSRKLSGKPVLFNNIKDYPGQSIFTGGISNVKSISIALGIEPPYQFKKVITVLKSRFLNSHKPEIIDKKSTPLICNYEQNVNLDILPTPWWHEKDCGRYIGTWHVNISKDPITGIRNAGVYRMKIIDKNHTTVSVSPHSHLARHFYRAEKLGKDLEMGVAIGTEEEMVMAASAALPYGVDEMSSAGGLLKKPIKLIHCQTSSLEVPLESEIVLEGVLKKGQRVTDGPFMDYAGKLSTNHHALLFEITAIQNMTNSIFRGMAVGNAGAEDHLLFSLLSHLGLTDFHGSRIRHLLQCFFLRYRFYKLFQYTGRAGLVTNRKDTLNKK